MAECFQLPPLFGHCLLAEVSWSSPFESKKLIKMTMPAGLNVAACCKNKGAQPWSAVESWNKTPFPLPSTSSLEGACVVILAIARRESVGLVSAWRASAVCGLW